MIEINFKKSDKGYLGFTCKGHASDAPSGESILCAFVSSACYLTANTITEVLKLDAKAEAKDGFMNLIMDEYNEEAQVSFKGLFIHMKELLKDYPTEIIITITEV